MSTNSVEMVRRLIEEVEMLRRRNGFLEPKAEAYDLVLKITNALERQGGAMGEDVLYEARKHYLQIFNEANPAKVNPPIKSARKR